MMVEDPTRRCVKRVTGGGGDDDDDNMEDDEDEDKVLEEDKGSKGGGGEEEEEEEEDQHPFQQDHVDVTNLQHLNRSVTPPLTPDSS